jgi:phage repressor protein C with HTH and peptisase S24 domain
MALSDRLRERRLAVGLSQAQLAEMIGSSQSLIAALERGAYTRTKLLLPLAQALEVSPAWLFEGDQELDQGGPDLAAALKRYAFRARRLKDLIRDRFGNSPDEFADAAGLPKKKVYQLLSGGMTEDLRLPDDLVEKIEHALNLPPHWFDTGGAMQAVSAQKAPQPRQERSLTGVRSTNLTRRFTFDRLLMAYDRDSKEVIWHPLENEAMSFASNLFQSLGSSPHDCRLVSYRGEDMSPLISDGDLLLIDVAQVMPLDGRIFAVCFEDEVLVKQVFKESGGQLTLHSHNNQTPSRSVSLTAESFRIIGQIVYRAGAL